MLYVMWGTKKGGYYFFVLFLCGGILPFMSYVGFRNEYGYVSIACKLQTQACLYALKCYHFLGILLFEFHIFVLYQLLFVSLIPSFGWLNRLSTGSTNDKNNPFLGQSHSLRPFLFGTF